MAHTAFWQWSVNLSTGLPPGGSQGAVIFGFPDHAAISVTAHVEPWSWLGVDSPGQPGMNILEIEHVRSEADDSGRQLSFIIRNVGVTTIFDFAVCFGFITG